jgi:hypothetical protein
MGKRTLLLNFIIDRLSNYKEPTRKGVPKGDPIGMSYSKYLICLVMLYNFPLKDIIKQAKDITRLADISYGLLRKWRTEPNFKEMYEKNCHDFTEYFITHFKEWHRSNKRELEVHFKDSLIADLSCNPLPHVDLRDFDDIPNYNQDILKTITSQLLDLINTDDLTMKMEVYLIFELMSKNKAARKASKRTLEALEKQRNA